MGKKRKSVSTSLDEVDRAMYSTFCSAANSLSQLYTHAMNQQKLTFQAGERHGLLGLAITTTTTITSLNPSRLVSTTEKDKLYQWILRQQEGGTRINTVEILSYLQTELDCCGEDISSPRGPPQNHNSQSQPAIHSTSSGFMAPLGSSVAPNTVQGFRMDHCDQQPKNYVFSNALSSPVRRSLQNYHIAQGGYHGNSGIQAFANGFRNNEPNFTHHQNRDSNTGNSNDSSMDMHADSPSHESTY